MHFSYACFISELLSLNHVPVAQWMDFPQSHNFTDLALGQKTESFCTGNTPSHGKRIIAFYIKN